MSVRADEGAREDLEVEHEVEDVLCGGLDAVLPGGAALGGLPVAAEVDLRWGAVVGKRWVGGRAGAGGGGGLGLEVGGRTGAPG